MGKGRRGRSRRNLQKRRETEATQQSETERLRAVKQRFTPRGPEDSFTHPRLRHFEFIRTLVQRGVFKK